MSDLIPVPAEALRWLRRLARAQDLGDGWDEGDPYPSYEELLDIGMVERRPVAFRLSDIGWWTLSHMVPKGEA